MMKFPHFGLINDIEKIDLNDFIRKAEHASVAYPSYNNCEKSYVSSYLILRDFQINLAKKLAANEGTFIITKIAR